MTLLNPNVGGQTYGQRVREQFNHPHIRHRLLKKGPKLIKKNVEDVISFSVNVFSFIYVLGKYNWVNLS